MYMYASYIYMHIFMHSISAKHWNSISLVKREKTQCVNDWASLHAAWFFTQREISRLCERSFNLGRTSKTSVMWGTFTEHSFVKFNITSDMRETEN